MSDVKRAEYPDLRDLRASPRYSRCHPVEDAIRNSEMEGLHVNADPLADSGELVARACARHGLA